MEAGGARKTEEDNMLEFAKMDHLDARRHAEEIDNRAAVNRLLHASLWGTDILNSPYIFFSACIQMVLALAQAPATMNTFAAASNDNDGLVKKAITVGANAARHKDEVRGPRAN